MKKLIAVPLLMATLLAACGQKTAPVETPAADTAVVVATPAPEAAPAPAPAAAAAAPVALASAADLAIGEKIYGTSCLSCHGAAVLGAPKLGDKPSWTPRLAKGVAVLHASAIDGFKMMPPRGGNAALKDEEVKAAVDFMVSKAM